LGQLAQFCPHVYIINLFFIRRQVHIDLLKNPNEISQRDSSKTKI
jgi:hypothetical protein